MSAQTNRVHDKMEKIKIRENLYQYYFAAANENSANSIFACLDETRHKTLLIDAAYPEYAERVKTDLVANGFQPEIVVLSHFHPDHTAGCSVFTGCPLYASRFYEDNYFNCTRWEPQYHYIHPTHLLTNGHQLSFGTFQISFIDAPGHSQCTKMIFINNDVLHVGDLLMFDNADKPTLPYISMGGSFKEHIRSLKQLKNMAYNTMIMAHGHPLNGTDCFIEQIDHRLFYLEKLANSNGEIKLEACLKTNLSYYANPEFHDNNLLQLMLES
jgi:glyoxylase-like metal-dependent hydrolase (beta-lactamase superfamily II)